MKITKIEIQKKNKSRYSLYSGENFLFGVTEDTLLHFSIFKGKEFSEEEIREIFNYEQVSRCLSQAYRYLARRPHLQKELERKLRVKKYSRPIIERTLEHLREKKYLNDEDFIRRFIKEEIRLKKSGPLRIAQKLFQKGAAPEAVKHVLQKTYPEEIQRQTAAVLVQKKWPVLKSAYPQKAALKLFSFLKQKGFYMETIKTVLPHSDDDE